MGKFDYRKLSAQERTALLNDFWDLLDVLHAQKGLRDFLSWFLTPSERVMFARRLQIAKALIAGETIEDIRERLRVGLTTIQSVDRWLEQGFGDYRTVLPPLVAHADRARSAHRPPPDLPGTFANLRRRYPGHFLLLNWILDG